MNGDQETASLVKEGVLGAIALGEVNATATSALCDLAEGAHDGGGYARLEVGRPPGKGEYADISVVGAAPGLCVLSSECIDWNDSAWVAI